MLTPCSNRTQRSGIVATNMCRPHIPSRLKHAQMRFRGCLPRSIRFCLPDMAGFTARAAIPPRKISSDFSTAFYTKWTTLLIVMAWIRSRPRVMPTWRGARSGSLARSCAGGRWPSRTGHFRNAARPPGDPKAVRYPGAHRHRLGPCLGRRHRDSESFFFLTSMGHTVNTARAWNLPARLERFKLHPRPPCMVSRTASNSMSVASSRCAARVR